MEKKYNKLILKFSNNIDNEEQHIEQDKIYRKFIKDIKSNKYKYDEIKVVADMITKKVIKYDKNRWYA